MIGGSASGRNGRFTVRGMFLSEIEAREPRGLRAASMRAMREAGEPVPQILHLFAFKPEATDHLLRFTHQVMRGPSPLSPGYRELIAAFTSQRNDCPF
jgi:alkylhydroperoxidase family enzyme